MNTTQQRKLEKLYQQQFNALRRQGEAPSTIDVYSPQGRRTSRFHDCCADRLNEAQLKQYFDALVRP